MTLVLRPMRQDEYEAEITRVNRDFAAELVRTGRAQPETAEAETERRTRETVPDGVATPHMLFFVGEVDGAPVGWIWLSLPGAAGHPAPGQAWVFNIEIWPEYRGRGYGRQLLERAEEELAERGVTAIGLNVFGHNTPAIRLYESLGYQVQAQQMAKPIKPPAAGTA